MSGAGGDLFADDLPVVHRGRRLAGTVAAVLVGDRPGFETRPAASLSLGLDGIAGDGHAGFSRKAGAREPWYPRGTEIRSGRQVSIVSVEELDAVAGRLGLPALDPALIGANLVLAGIAKLSFLPAGTRLFFPSGAALVVEGQNAPCRDAGEALAARHGAPDLALRFVEAATRRRGLVASVERAGPVEAGSIVKLRVPEQWIYG